MRPTLRIATSGWFTIGVWKSPASLPALVTVNVEPRSSSGGGRAANVVLRDPPLRARPFDRREVDAELVRDAAHERCRTHLRLRRRLLGARLVAVGLAADDDEHRADRDDLPLGHEDPGHRPRGGRRDLDGRLVGLDLDERVVLGDLLALGDEPARDLALGQTLPEVGELELVGHRPEPSVESSYGSPKSRLTSNVRPPCHRTTSPLMSPRVRSLVGACQKNALRTTATGSS